MRLTCPVCNHHQFWAVGNRPYAECATCHSRERHRHLALFFLSLNERRRILFITNDAPFWIDIGSRLGLELQLLPVSEFGEARRPGGSFDIVAHEHIANLLPFGLVELHRHVLAMLAPGGLHAFAVPIHADKPGQDLSDADEATRERAFGRADVRRSFGIECLQSLFSHYPIGSHLFDPTPFFGPTAAADAGIVINAGSFNNSSIFVLAKP